MEKDMKYGSATIRLGFKELLTLPSWFSSPLVTVYSLLPLSLWNFLLWLTFFSVPSTVTVDFPPDTAGNLIQHPACSWYKKIKASHITLTLHLYIRHINYTIQTWDLPLELYAWIYTAYASLLKHCTFHSLQTAVPSGSHTPTGKTAHFIQ